MIEQNNPKVYQGTLARNPTGRTATPQEIASAAVFLAQPGFLVHIRLKPHRRRGDLEPGEFLSGEPACRP
jgi:NAD(P)-dependent dehydrogenase (short-subunit alcohol dehydrogenase family)